MTDDIKLPPYPEGLCLREDIEDYAREAVHLNAQAVPDTREMFNAGWCAAARFCDREDAVYDGLVGPGGCPAFEVAYRAALSAAQEAPAGPTRQQIIDWLDALDIEVTDKQLAGLFDVVAMETTQDAPACLSKPGDSEEQSALPLADERQLAAQAVPQGFSTKVLNAIQQLIAYSEGSKSAEIVRHCRELSAWIDTAQPAAHQGDALSYVHPVPDHCDRVVWRNRYLHLATQAQEAAPAARGEPSDTERDAARYRWLRERVSVWRTNDGSGPVSWFPVAKVPASSSLQDETDAAIDWSIFKE